MLEYFDRDGTPLEMLEWARKFEDREYARVAKTEVGHWWISTVWLGLNHAYFGGPPLIFESMVFWHGPTGGEPDHDRPQYRYSTLAQARRGHARLVREYRTMHKQLRELPSLKP